jgi:hypothetical protein
MEDITLKELIGYFVNAAANPSALIESALSTLIFVLCEMKIGK